MRRHEINLIASSDESSGAVNISDNGSQFEILLDEPIHIPRDAENVTVSMEEATVWWVVPNIITGTNDQLSLTDTNAGTNPSGTAHVYTITIPQGLYDLPALNQTIQRELASEGAGSITPPLMTLTADDATQKVEITLNYTALTIDFTIANSFRDIVGFNSQVIGPSASSPITYLGDNSAGFNVINSFLIHSNIVSRGVRLNNRYSQILDQVLIDVLPGSQIVQTKLRPPIIDERILQGTIRNTIKFWITDESGNDISTAGEPFSVRLAIRYETPIRRN